MIILLLGIPVEAFLDVRWWAVTGRSLGTHLHLRSTILNAKCTVDD